MQTSDSVQSENLWRRIALRLVAFCLPIVLGWAALEYWAIRVPPNNLYSLKRERLQALANEVDTVIIGSSSASMGIEPKLLSGSAVNLGHDGEDLYDSDALITRVVPQLPKLKRVILQIHYISLYYSIPETDTAWRQCHYLQEWDIPPAHLSGWFDCQMWSRVAFRTPRFWLETLREGFEKWRRTGNFRAALIQTNVIDDRGWELGADKSLRFDLSPAAVASKVAHQHRRSNPENVAENIQHLDHILSVLHQRHIEADLVTTPVWHTYQEAMRMDWWNETMKVVAQRTNNSNVFYYPFLSVPQLEPHDFADANHLSPRGAARFTKMLDSALNHQDPNSRAQSSSLPANSLF